MIGTTLSHFRIVDKLGEGGMGEVWRAEDTKLGREVALKVLPQVFAEDAERMARFAREAQVLASLNHPNIAAIYQVEQEGETRFLVMELVEGETLQERLQRGPLGVEEALRLALQVASALEEAHDLGIIHRDLKPANVKVTPRGQVKVLDFGLAKALEGDPKSSGSHPALTQSPTLTAQMTGAGVLLGTAAYMSPEQARGEIADRRSDIWAFGVVLMEMLTGRTVYAGKTISDTLAGVLAREPEWNGLPAGTPRSVRRLLERCLEKETKDRLQAIGEARIAIDSYLLDPSSDTAVGSLTGGAPQPAWKRWLPWVALTAAAVATIAAIVGWSRVPARSGEELMRLSVEVPAERNLMTQIGCHVQLSPNGKLLAYVLGDPVSRSLFVRPLDQLEGVLVSGSDLAYLPFFSPDNEWVGFVTPSELKKVSVSGGTPLTIAEVSFCRGATWGEDGTIVFTPDVQSPLFRVPAAGGEPEALTTLDEAAGETTHRWPEFLPGAKALLFVSHSKNGQFTEAVIEALDLASGERKVLIRGGTYPRYARSGHLMYVREATLYGVPFDAERLEVTGTAGPLVEGLISNEELYGSAQYSLSRDGKLAYMTGEAAQANYSVSTVDFDGVTAPLIEETVAYFTPRYSPDGRRLAIDQSPTGDGDIWVQDLQRGIGTRITFDPADDTWPIWSPDGEWLVFRSNRAATYDLYRVASDGSGEPEPLLETESDLTPNDWSGDGQWLTYTDSTGGQSDLRVLPMGGEGEPEEFLATRFTEYGATFSPDDRWLAYGSNESGGWEIYVRPFPKARGEWKVSTGTRATYPFWSRDGRRIYYRTPRGIASVTVDGSGSGFEFERPEILFEGDFVDGFPQVDFHVAPDNSGFVMFTGAVQEQDFNHFVLATGWYGELERTFSGARE